jgi:lysophospholipase L1-like esterase
LSTGSLDISSSRIRVACVGDSITQGTQYPFDLSILLGPNYEVRNFGDSGSSVCLNSTNPYLNSGAFQNATKFQPNIVIVMLGTNDAHPNLQQYNASFVSNYMELINAFQSLNSKPKLWIVLPPPVFNNSTSISPDYFALNVIPSIEETAKQANLPTINVYSALANDAYCFPDGVHPDGEGAKMIADEIFIAII